jgi:hypothetical protein
MLTDNDLQQIQNKGISKKEIESQLANFKNGFPFVNLIKPATAGDGIIRYDEETVKKMTSFYDDASKDRQILKFVPASGAASRMFKQLFEFREKYKASLPQNENYLNDKEFQSVNQFITEIQNFAFYEDLKSVMNKNGIDIEFCINEKKFTLVIDYLLEENGLGYANLPKGLLKFHRYPNGSRTSVEEHLVEGANYCRQSDGRVFVHFTVSPEHWEKFEQKITETKHIYESLFHCKYTICFSEQKSSTDIIAVDMNNEPFREDDGCLLFRPGGHGALIENLNDLQGDIIFIKNIDNIVPDHLKEQTYLYKKVIGGTLLRLQEQTFSYLEMLDDGNVSDAELEEIAQFAKNQLNLKINELEGFSDIEKIDYLFNTLNRPMRICGMVKNEGEPGGGPFWVENENGEISLQIVESSQVDMNDTRQKEILNKSTHFNPVDLVCGVQNYKGEKFDLTQFVDASTGFISVKSKDGRSLKAQELPGLWNGAMADWITIFVETPIITFNPVKTVNDLLRKEHQ